MVCQENNHFLGWWWWATKEGTQAVEETHFCMWRIAPVWAWQDNRNQNKGKKMETVGLEELSSIMKQVRFIVQHLN